MTSLAAASAALFALGSCERVEGCEYTGSCPELSEGGAGGSEAGSDAGQGGAGVHEGGAPAGGQSGADSAGQGGEISAGEAGAGGAQGGAGGNEEGSAGGSSAGEASACSSECDGATAVCDEASGDCVQCLTAENCPAEAPVCDEIRRTCVACLADEHCSGETPACDASTNTCVACTEPVHCEEATPLCNAQSQSCVECLSQTDCTSDDASRCANGRCEPCVQDTDCGHLPNQSLCHAGTCVECTVADESPCAGRSCNPETLRCTSTPVNSVGYCEPCVADSECTGNDRAPEILCVPMRFQTDLRTTGFCLQRFSGSCLRPFVRTPEALSSLSGADPDYFCGVDQDSTRCEAILDLINGRTCPDGQDNSCGCVRDADGNCAQQGRGGVCETVAGVPNSCTYPCGTVNDCPTGKTCTLGAPFCR